MTINIETTRKAWARAADFPAEKEKVYPEHAKAHEFDTMTRKSVLEYGCGGGSDTLSIARRGGHVTYADVVPTNVTATARRMFDAGLHGSPLILQASATIPLPDASFDVVTSHGVLHHIEDPTPVMREFRRLLRPCGVLYVMLYTETLAARCVPEIERHMRENGISREEAFCWVTDGPGAPYARSYTQSQGEELLRSTGFTPVGSTVYNNGDFRTFKAER